MKESCPLQPLHCFETYCGHVSQTIDKCSVIWVISDIERVSGGRAHEDLLNESIKACQRGFCRDVALVVTKTDKLHLPEYLRYHAGPAGRWAFLHGPDYSEDGALTLGCGGIVYSGK